MVKDTKRNKQTNKWQINKIESMKTHHTEIIFVRKVDTHIDDNQRFSYKNRKRFFLVSLAKKFFFPRFFCFYMMKVFAMQHASAHTLNKITIAVSRNIILMEFTRILWLCIMNIKCNKFIILCERVKMPFLWLRVFRCAVHFALSYSLYCYSEALVILYGIYNNGVNKTILPDDDWKEYVQQCSLLRQTESHVREQWKHCRRFMQSFFNIYISSCYPESIHFQNVIVMKCGHSNVWGSVVCFYFYMFYFLVSFYVA